MLRIALCRGILHRPELYWAVRPTIREVPGCIQSGACMGGSPARGEQSRHRLHNRALKQAEIARFPRHWLGRISASVVLSPSRRHAIVLSFAEPRRRCTPPASPAPAMVHCCRPSCSRRPAYDELSGLAPSRANGAFRPTMLATVRGTGQCRPVRHRYEQTALADRAVNCTKGWAGLSVALATLARDACVEISTAPTRSCTGRSTSAARCSFTRPPALLTRWRRCRLARRLRKCRRVPAARRRTPAAA
jgi:hypothetical protein